MESSALPSPTSSIYKLAPELSSMAAVSPLHSEDGRRLLDIIDKLKLLPSISHEIALPQIVVVGQQSSGKSSVLKAISNIDFPTNSGFCTQFATEIICRRESIETTKAQIVPDDTIDETYRRKLEAFSEKWSQITPDRSVSDIIEDAKQVMGLNSHRRISKDKLRLEFSGPTQDHISLIDLPGLFEQELPGQRENDKRLVDEMVKDYISGKHTIILAVVSGAYDIQVQRIFRMFEPYHSRTLGIITAPDLVESGTARAATFRKLVINASFKAGHGWHVLRNLSHREEQEGRNRSEVEEQFFANRSSAPNNVWTDVDDTCLGIHNLKSKLAGLLQGSISEGLPHIQRQLRSAHRECEDALKLLGSERSTPEQRRDYLADKSELLRACTIRELNGTSGKHSLRSRIRNANDLFANNITRYGAYWEFVHGETDTSDADSQSEIDMPMPITDDEWLAMMFEEISNSRGRELDGLVDPIWVGRMFLRQSRKWRSFAECHIDEAFSLVEDYFSEIIETVVGAENAPRFLVHTIQPELQRRNEALKKKLHELLSPYSTEHLRTLNRNFRVQQPDLTPILKNEPSKKALTQHTIAHYTSFMDEYYYLALNVFVDNVESLAIENVLLGGLEDVMTANKAHKMSEDDLAALASESSEIMEKRRLLTSRLKDYGEGSKIMARYSIQYQRLSRSEQRQFKTGKKETKSDLLQATAALNLDDVHEVQSEVSSSKSSSTETTVDIGSRERQDLFSSSTDSSRASSVSSRIFSDGEENLSSIEPTPQSTPLKPRNRRNKFERIV